LGYEVQEDWSDEPPKWGGGGEEEYPFSENLVAVYQSTQGNIPEDLKLQRKVSQKLEAPQILFFFFFFRSPPEFTRLDYQRISRIIEPWKILNIMGDTKSFAELEEVAWEEWKELAFHSLYSASDRRTDGI
jgi:hypothetical protein